MAKIFLKCEGKKGSFLEARRCFLAVSDLKKDKDGDLLLFPAEYRSVSDLQATVDLLKGQLDLAVKKAKNELQP